MKYYKCTIKGNAPYYYTKPTKEEKVPKTEEQKKASALRKVYNNGGLLIPNRQIKRAMMEAARTAKMKTERSAARTVKLFSTNLLQIQPQEIYIQPEMAIEDIILEEWFIHEAGIWSYIARVDEWELTFDVVFSEVFEPSFIKEALENAGLLSCIGGRRGLGNGAFDVISFEEGDDR